MPMRQMDLADLLGMTPVHVNCSLQELRAAGLVVLKQRRLHILDVVGLRAFCGFEPGYLHLQIDPDPSVTRPAARPPIHP